MKTQFDMNQGSKGEWFPYFGSKLVKKEGNGEPIIEYLAPEPDAGKVCIRLADQEAMARVQKETRTKKSEFVYNTKTRQMERVPYIEQTPEQEKRERELIWDHAIVEWEGLYDSEGKVIPCTLDSKMKLMLVPEFSRFIARCLELLAMTKEERLKALEKN